TSSSRSTASRPAPPRPRPLPRAVPFAQRTDLPASRRWGPPCCRHPCPPPFLSSPRASRSPPRRPPFRRPDAVRRRLPVDAAGAGLAGHGPGVLPRRRRHLAARPADQRLCPGRRPGTDLAPRRDGGCRLRPVDGRRPLPVATRRRRLASPPAVVSGRCLL